MVIRVEKNKNYTVMSNYHLRDKNLTLRAKGLMAFILSLPDEWDYTEMGLVACLKEGRGAIRSALKELENFGYLVRKRIRQPDGTMGTVEYTIYEKPMSEKPMLENPTLDNPTSEKPMLDNRTQIKTKVINKDLTSKEEINTKAASGNMDCSPELAQALKSFEEHRKKLHKPMTDRAKELLLAKLSKLGRTEQEQIAILNQSIMNGWQGIFPLGGEKKQSYNKPTAADMAEQAKQLLREKRGADNDGTGTGNDNGNVNSRPAWFSCQ